MAIAHQTLDAARRRLEDEDRKGWRYLCIFVPMLIVLFLVGLGLLIFAAAYDRPWAYGGGGLVEGAIIWPIKELLALHRRRVNLGMVVALLSLADEKEAKKKVLRLIDVLIEQVGS